MTLISIIMPAFQAHPYISEAVKSVLSQTIPNWELIIISDDQTNYEQHLANQNISDPRIHFASTGATATGAAHARNIGLEAAKGEIIAQLDADDLFHPQKLEIMAPKAQNYGLSSCALQITDENLTPLRTIGTGAIEGLYPNHTYKNINFSGDNMLIFDRKKHSHFYDTELKLLEDLDFASKCLQNAPTFYHSPMALHTYRKVKTSSSNHPQAVREFIKIKTQYLQALGSPSSPGDQKFKAHLIAFLQSSLQAEATYIEHSNGLFEDHLESVLTHQF